ncbi:hypothetical protein CSE16_05145 [Solibacillus sp. R5-41]|uniref:hypothetical protein n=1 Tax=Solibacillus sp. R5-41 TaxID=2048654 RepID=UPI000C12697A|nr:hypothetical protein [Solibacillus sp. R5-41]ATP39484.1 hypothetical protein CSE16_05145 [Solibacillus sp. R5-41]
MSNPKKQIIMNEITFWKQNKLLPEHYCDFLMTLYSEGNNNEEISGNAKKAINPVIKRRKWSIASIFPVIALLFTVLLFTIQYEWVVVAIAGIFAASCLVGAFYFAKRNKLLATMLQLAVALLMLGISVKISMTYFAGNNNMLFALLITNCILWLISGIMLKITYFTISGVIGFCIIIGAWFYI